MILIIYFDDYLYYQESLRIQKHQISKIGPVTLLYEQIGHYLAQLVAPQSGLHVIEPPM